MSSRIVGYEEVSLETILFNPMNWRIHPERQQTRLNDLLDKVGWANAVVINKQTGNLIDGHLRCQLAARRGEVTVPALFVNVSPDEEKLLLASMDSIGATAAVDKGKYMELIRDLTQTFEEQTAYLTDLTYDAYGFDIQPMLEVADFDAFLAELADQVKAEKEDPRYVEADEVESYYGERVKLVKLEMTMLPDQKQTIMQRLTSIVEDTGCTIAEALVKAVTNAD